jgi:hypothetical protein
MAAEKITVSKLAGPKEPKEDIYGLQTKLADVFMTIFY